MVNYWSVYPQLAILWLIIGFAGLIMPPTKMTATEFIKLTIVLLWLFATTTFVCLILSEQFHNIGAKLCLSYINYSGIS